MLVNIWCGDLAGIVAGELERCAASMQGAQVWDHLQGSPLPDVYFQAAVPTAWRLGSQILSALANSGETTFCFVFICRMRAEKIWSVPLECCLGILRHTPSVLKCRVF